MKYDKTETAYTKTSITKKDFGFTDSDLIFVAGSTREKEEEIVIDVYKKLAEEFLSIKLIVAPRYPERCSEIEKILQKENISFIRKSQLSTMNYEPSTINCLLLDTIGELTDAYSIGTVIFVGGSLFAGAGGHNMLEPAELGKTVIFGKFVKNFQESAELLILQKAAFQVGDKEEFFNRAKELLDNLELRDAMGKRAKEVVISRRGATDNNLKIISEILNKNANERK